MIEKKQMLIRIVDDDEPFADAICFLLLSKGLRAVVHASAEKFLEQDDPSVPGCLILDYQMPELNGIETQRKLLDKGWCWPVIFMTAHADVGMAITAFKQGACDLLQKPVAPDVLIAAVETSLEKVRAGMRHHHDEVCGLFEGLTNRERQIVKLAAAGLANQQIADRLGISERTVEAHRSAAYRRLNVKCLEELQAFIRDMDD